MRPKHRREEMMQTTQYPSHEPPLRTRRKSGGSPTNRNRGFTMTEVLAALALAGVLVGAISSFGALQSVRSKLADQRLTASQELANRMSEITARPYQQIDEAWAADLAIHADHAPLLAAYTYEVTIEPTDSPVPGKRIELALVSDTPHLPPYRLTAWKFAPAAMPAPGEDPPQEDPSPETDIEEEDPA